MRLSACTEFSRLSSNTQQPIKRRGMHYSKGKVLYHHKTTHIDPKVRFRRHPEPNLFKLLGPPYA